MLSLIILIGKVDNHLSGGKKFDDDDVNLWDTLYWDINFEKNINELNIGRVKQVKNI